jgi:hypothetical protein
MGTTAFYQDLRLANFKTGSFLMILWFTIMHMWNLRLQSFIILIEYIAID